MSVFRTVFIGLEIVALMLAATPANADLVLSELIVDLQPGKQIRDDLEVWNNSPERAFVAIEPREIVDPSLPTQRARQDPDPEKLGILVTPARMILEPGQRKLIRVAAVSARFDREHVFRVTVKPVSGGIQSNDSGLKIMVGYDVLVLVRPAQAAANVVGTRSGKTLTFDNRGNVSVEMIEGRQCISGPVQCTDLPGKRLYPGASWSIELPADQPAQYTLKYPGHADRKTF